MTPPPGDRYDGASANPAGRITRDVVLAAALELIDRDGVDGLSMRRLARVLGRDPMILYRHAPNTAALLDGVAETVLAQLKVDPADPDWAAQLRAVARGYRAGAGPPERGAAAGHPAELQELIENLDETDDLLRLGLHRLPIRQFPLLRSLAPALASYDGAAELERGLDILLTGLTDSLPPAAAQAAAGTVPGR
jgi:AcrR family transcriptional regulator